MVICLERGADLHMAQLMPLPLTVSCSSNKSRLVLPFWYRLTQVVLVKRPLNGCSVVVVVERLFCHFYMLSSLVTTTREIRAPPKFWQNQGQFSYLPKNGGMRQRIQPWNSTITQYPQLLVTYEPSMRQFWDLLVTYELSIRQFWDLTANKK